jgi:hypothetical protein
MHSISIRHPSRGTARLALWPLLAPALLGVGGCVHRSSAPLPPSVQFSREIREILTIEHPSLEYYDARSRLEAMGPEVDAVLTALAYDAEANPIARANALILLADRRSPIALDVLRRMLLTSRNALLRSAAVLGLQRLGSRSEEAMDLIRSAIGDPDRQVRINALQALDIRDVALVRTVLESETDREVRRIAEQLVALAETRGAPLAPDRRGALRTTGPDSVPHLVFRAAHHDSVAGTAIGDLRLERPAGPDIPLAAAAEVVGDVVPAFFSPNRSKVVYEAEREVRVLDLETLERRSLGRGIAPRLIPFTDHFVFLREQPGARREVEEGTEIRYHVLRAAFGGETPELVGELRAVARMERHAHYSPVRWMVVGETPVGFVLIGEGISTLLISNPVWRPDEAPRPGAPSFPFH